MADTAKDHVPPTLETKHLSFELKDLSADGSFEGYGAYFGNVDFGKDVIEKGAFDASVDEHKSNDSMPGLYFGHDEREPIGDWTGMKANARGLLMTGQLWIGKGIPKVEQTYMMLKSKGPKGLSIGYYTRKAKYDEKTGIRTLIDLDVKEVSVTPSPMNPKAKITAVKSLLLTKSSLTIREAEDFLRDVGKFSHSDAKAFLASVYSGFKQRDVADQDLLSVINNTLKILKG
jgi:hypothetical protein